MIRINSSGSFHNLEAFFRRVSNGALFTHLNRYGQMGVDALSNATPLDTGETATAWNYRIVSRGGRYTIEWFNNNMAGDTPVVILIQYGHGTGTGGYVEGRDFINPAIRPIFDRIANEVWEEVKR